MCGSRKRSISTVELHYFCHTLHVILFILQVVLFAMLWGHPERNITMAFNNKVLAIGLSAFLQAFYTLYTTLLVFLMQRLTLIRFLSRPQILTATHDISGAWAGLGAATTALWRQTNLSASTRATILIFMYLSCVFVLHAASSTVMGFESYIASITVNVPASSMWPNTSTNLSALDTQTASELMALMSNLTGLSTDGLLDNTLHDTLNVTSQMVGASLNAHTIRANCGLLNVSYTVDSANLLSVNASSVNGIVQMSNLLFGPPASGPGVPVSYTCGFEYGNALMYAVSTPMKINSSLGCNVTFNPAVLGSQYSNSSLVYLIGCSLDSYDYTSNLDFQSGMLDPMVNQPDAPSQAWSTWSPSEDDLGTQLDLMVISAYSSGVCPVGSPCVTINTLNNYLAALLATEQLNGIVRNSASVPLTPYQFENALSQMAAQLLWIAGRLSGGDGGFLPTSSVAQVTEQMPKWRLNINKIPVIFTLNASFVLLVTAFLILGVPSKIKKDVPSLEGTSVLEMLWAGAHFDSLRKRLTAIRPSSKDLRLAGTFNACFTKSELAQEIESAEAIPLLFPEAGIDAGFKDGTHANSASKSWKRIKRSPRALQLIESQYLWCYLLHGLFVLLHVVLLSLLANHPEHHVIVQSASGVSTTALAASLQLFYVVYTLLLVFITQRLAVSRALARVQNMTSVHDLSQAWTGAGSAFVGVWQQIKVVASLRTTLAITTYYLCISILHITSTTVIKFEAFDSIRNHTAQSTLAWPTSGFGTYDWLALVPLVPLDQLPSLSTKGWIKNSVYDVPTVDSTSVNATVNVTTIRANCGLLPVVNSTDGTNINVTIPTLGTLLTPLLPLLVNDTSMHINSQILFNVSNSSFVCSNCDEYLMYFVTTPLDIDASLDNVGMTSTYYLTPGANETASETIYLVACSLNVTTMVDVLDVQNYVLANTDLLVSADEAQRSWSLWSPVGNIPALTNEISSALASVGPMSITRYPIWCERYIYTTMDMYTMSLLGREMDVNGSVSLTQDATVTVSRSQFEDAISQIAAQYVWAAGHTNGNYGPTYGFGESVVTDLDMLWRLNINTVPAIIAFVASFVLLVLAIYMVGIGPSTPTLLSELGVLETLWLEAHSEVLHARMREVADPTLDNLRAAGMFKICLGDEARKALDRVDPIESSSSLVRL